MHPTLENALEEIDAAIFSGDTFMHEEGRKVLREYLERWNRWDQSSCYFTADGTTMDADGTVSDEQ